ncbi:MAG: sugar phosphate isomerase/epimerase [Oscillospiraceae bacterium]|nr:sugar phosphate isomerase/epimerase [Oscillospiraceae bacterium]MCL2277790.1 sugar phosphate isomerase/epimerase [Oscillospiraceae bacterium]
MKIGFVTQNYSEKPLEEVAKMVSERGYEALEIATYDGNGQCDTQEWLKNGKAAAMRKMIESYGLSISALSNHADSLLIMGPHGADTDGIFKGTKEEKIKFGTESLIASAQLANELEVDVVIGFTGVENFGRYFPFPYPKGWEYEEQCFAEHFVPIFDKFKEYGVKFAVEPHPNNFIYDIHTSLRALELADNHPCLGFNLDPANIIYLGLHVESYINALKDRIFTVHAKDGEIVAHNIGYGGILMQGSWQRLDRTYRFRIPGWGSVEWKKVITELAMVGYNGVLSYEHEDVTMSRADGMDKTIEFLKPLLIQAPYEGRHDKLFTK